MANIWHFFVSWIGTVYSNKILCWTYFIWEAYPLISEADGGILDIVSSEGNEGFEPSFFRGRWYVSHTVLEQTKTPGFICSKTNLVDGFLLWCFLFWLLFLYYMTRHNTALYHFFSWEVYTWIQIRVLRGGDVFFIVHQYYFFFLNIYICGYFSLSFWRP